MLVIKAFLLYKSSSDILNFFGFDSTICLAVVKFNNEYVAIKLSKTEVVNRNPHVNEQKLETNGSFL